MEVLFFPSLYLRKNPPAIVQITFGIVIGVMQEVALAGYCAGSHIGCRNLEMCAPLMLSLL
jgi:hypothetical protein